MRGDGKRKRGSGAEAVNSGQWEVVVVVVKAAEGCDGA
jgi:hypothetical protein